MSDPERDSSGHIEWSRFDAVLFDLDGVLTPTAKVHQVAWKETFDRFLATLGDTEMFSDDDYLRYVDGRPRYDGVRTMLESRDITLPDGKLSDPPGFETVTAVGNLKNRMFTDVLRRDGVDAYPGSVALIDALEEIGLDMAVVSSSANASAVLEAAGLNDRFPVVVDGQVARSEGLAGKPSPATFVFAAVRLGTEPVNAVVIEDAVSGVEAGRSGGFGLVVGVDRAGHAAQLAEAGADLVVADLSELV